MTAIMHRITFFQRPFVAPITIASAVKGYSIPFCCTNIISAFPYFVKVCGRNFKNYLYIIGATPAKRPIAKRDPGTFLGK